MALSPPQQAYVRHRVAHEIAKLEGRKAMSDIEWCKTMDLHRNTAGKYKADPRIKAAIEADVKQAKESKDFFRYVMRRIILEELWVRYENAKPDSAEKRHYMKMLLDETADVIEETQCVDYATLSDDDLEAIALAVDTSPLAKTTDELRALVCEMKGETWKPPLLSEEQLPEDSDASSSTDTLSEADGTAEIVSASKQVSRRLRSTKNP